MSARAGEKAALKVVGMVLDSGAFFNIALAEVFTEGDFSDKDRAAASAISRTVIENKLALEYALAQVTDLKRCKKAIRNILFIGAARVLFSDMPGAAAVSSAVDFCRGVGKGAQAGYVNAVLRALSSADIEWPDAGQDLAKHLSIRYSWPEWYCKEIIGGFGYEFAREYLSYREQMPVSLRINPRRTNRRKQLEALADMQISGLEPSVLDNDGILAKLSDAAGTDGYKRGLYSLQGEGSMLAARQALVDGLVLDMCAAPGGKSMYIAERMGSGKVVACDIHGHRLELMAKQAARLGLDNLEIIEHDARKPLEQYIGKADCVLVDAPCTGLGTALNRPDVKLNKTLDDAKQLSELQYEIILASSAMVKSGGRLVYCTCTPTPIETTAVVGRFIQTLDGFAPDSLALPDGVGETQQGQTLLWPHTHGTDAFYICRMVKL